MLSSMNLRIFRNHPSVDGKSAFNRIELRLGLESHEFVGSGLFEICEELMDIFRGRRGKGSSDVPGAWHIWDSLFFVAPPFFVL